MKKHASTVAHLKSVVFLSSLAMVVPSSSKLTTPPAVKHMHVA